VKPLSRPNRCRLDELPDYVSGQLSAQRTLEWDRHLIACGGCQHAVAAERRLQTLLSAGCPSMPGGLHAQLVALATSMPAAPSTGHETRRHDHSPLQMVAPTAPPAHRSPLKSAALATAAAGATAAVAWTLTLAGPGAMATSVGAVSGGGQSPTARPAAATPGATTGAPRVRTVSTGWTGSTSVRNLVLCEAESRS
jgi:anti-sigma factor RsiW